MAHLSVILTKCAARLILAAIFSACWYYLNNGAVSPNAPLVFCGAICLAAAWLAYLRMDGLALFSKHSFSIKRLFSEKMRERIERVLPRRMAPEPTTDEDTPQVRIAANLGAGVLLIAVSFLF